MVKSINALIVNNPLLVIPLVLLLSMFFPLAEMIIDGLLSPWGMLPSPPSQPIQLLGTGADVSKGVDIVVADAAQPGYVQGDLYLLADDGQVYYYERNDETWRKGLAEHVHTFESCDSAGPFWDRKDGECVQRSYAGLTHFFLLDQGGDVWYWFDSPQLSSPFCAAIGLVFGVLAFIYLLTRNRRKFSEMRE